MERAGAVVPEDQVLPAVAALGTPVSIDSMKAEVVALALDNGASIANDVWGLQRDPAMAEVVASHRVPVIVMHNRDAADPTIDIIDDILTFFDRSLAIIVGLIMLLALEIGYTTPPFGLLLFTMKSVAPPEIRMSEIIRAAVPYMIFGLILTVVILFVPGIATWLPRLLQ